MLSKPSISDLRLEFSPRLPNILSQPSQLQASSLSDVEILYEHFYIIASVKQTVGTMVWMYVFTSKAAEAFGIEVQRYISMNLYLSTKLLCPSTANDIPSYPS
jgi:hypothetical protein